MIRRKIVMYLILLILSIGAIVWWMYGMQKGRLQEIEGTLVNYSMEVGSMA